MSWLLLLLVVLLGALMGYTMIGPAESLQMPGGRLSPDDRHELPLSSNSKSMD